MPSGGLNHLKGFMAVNSKHDMDFLDVKHKKTNTLGNSLIVDKYRALASGATVSFPARLSEWKSLEPEWVQIIGGLRNSARNTLLGAILTKPDDSSFLLGITWRDKKDGLEDEDITLFEEISPDKFSFERLKPAQAQKRFPAWHPYHHGDKSFLK